MILLEATKEHTGQVGRYLIVVLKRYSSANNATVPARQTRHLRVHLTAGVLGEAQTDKASRERGSEALSSAEADVACDRKQRVMQDTGTPAY